MSILALGTISRKSAKEMIVERVREAILSGELSPGQRVTEPELAKSFAVGQTTVREAMIELEHLGFIQRRAPRKTFVTSLTREDILKIYAIRLPLELLAIQFMVESGAETRSLVDAVEKMEAAADKGDVGAFKARDQEFHRVLWAATGNQYLAECLEPLVGQLFAFAFTKIRRQQLVRKEKLLELAAWHRGIVTALQSGAMEAAQEAMRASMDMSWIDDDQSRSSG